MGLGDYQSYHKLNKVNLKDEIILFIARYSFDPYF